MQKEHHTTNQQASTKQNQQVKFILFHLKDLQLSTKACKNFQQDNYDPVNQVFPSVYRNASSIIHKGLDAHKYHNLQTVTKNNTLINANLDLYKQISPQFSK